MRKRAGWLLCGLAAVLVLGTASVVQGGHDASEVHSVNMTLVSNYDEGGAYRSGTDLAFWGNRMIAGALDQNVNTAQGGFRIFDISNPAELKLIGRFRCWGDQNDPSIWKDIVILSIDKPTGNTCADRTAPTGQQPFEGIRIVSIADPANPQEVLDVATQCGSHTNTIVPDRANQRLLVYVLSYPLAGRYNPDQTKCNATNHSKISVVQVPMDNPAGASLVGTVPVSGPSAGPVAAPAPIGCHDVTVFLDRQLAAAACLTESQMWDISNPASPKVVARIPNPAGMNLSHSTTFSNDGKTLVIGDELGGAAASPGCLSGSEEDLPGGLFFYDVTDGRAPRYLDAYKLPRQVASEFCTAHQFNVVPLRDKADILVTSWYTGATSVIDFTRVREGVGPEEIAHYIPEGALARPISIADPTGASRPTEAAAWASYWYRGHIWTSNFDEDVNSVSPRSRGIDVFKVDHPFVDKAISLPRMNPQLQEHTPGSAG